MITKIDLITNSNASEKSVVLGKQYRFTVLTSRLIRLEYNKNGHFEDMPTQTVINRNFETPFFNLYETDDILEIETLQLHLKYDKNEFNGNGLSVHVRDISGIYMSTWHYGDIPKDLGGTARTLDDVNGMIPLESGIISKEGFSILDDSKSLRITQDNWIAPRTEESVDLYFFGYGRDYWQAVQDFYHLTGDTPLLPRFALGNWWSRYHPYTEEEYIKLMNRFQENKIPFSVAVIDMDWHLTDIDPKYGSGWTGYTWNKKLIPDPSRFMNRLHDKHLKVTLNVHPADGVRPSEEMYDEMAKAMEMDTDRRPSIPFDFTNPKFAESYFKILHHPKEGEGVDFWWIDWQQGKNTKIEGLDPLWMLNHYHYLDNAKEGKRPLTLSRYAGPGSHRYPLGFSGDTHATWESLQFQPYFTANASNIGYGWWSHDIGGHMLGIKDDEMVTRWIQFGVFSPINRLHSSDNIFSGKEPWNYGIQYQKAIEMFLRLRHRFIPYLHSMNKRSHEGKPLIVPMYYNEPWNENTYDFNNEYYFGTEFVVAPITQPVDKESQTASVNAWIPKGKWIDFFTGFMYSGNTRTTLYRSIDEIPVLVKLGSIIPLADLGEFTNSINNPEKLELMVYAGASGNFVMWEDSNEEEYRKVSWMSTEFTLDWNENPVFTIHPADGCIPDVATIRDYTIHIINVPEQKVQILINGKLIEDKATWQNQQIQINFKNVKNTDNVQVILSKDELEEPDKLERVYRFLNNAQIEYSLKLKLYEEIKAEKSFSKLVRNLESRNLNEHIYGGLLEILGSNL